MPTPTPKLPDFLPTRIAVPHVATHQLTAHDGEYHVQWRYSPRCHPLSFLDKGIRLNYGSLTSALQLTTSNSIHAVQAQSLLSCNRV
jgi:hypothetical protein